MGSRLAGPQLNAGRPGGSGQQRRKAQAEESELPVFCVSAKDCQRIEGRTSKDGFPSAFTKIEYTEMPQLRKHVHHVTGVQLPENEQSHCMFTPGGGSGFSGFSAVTSQLRWNVRSGIWKQQSKTLLIINDAMLGSQTICE